jgi:hypothetical protein
MADLRIDLAAEFRGKKAFQEADKSVSSLDKAVGKLGKRIASVFAAEKILAFGKATVKAFTEDQAAASRLANVVKNLGLEFSNAAIANYIDKLTLATGVSDTQLRPAFQALLTTTGDLVNSQKLLSQAIDISAGSGVELTQVAQDLANAYVGKTKALTKYNLGLTQSELKTMKFADLMARLNKQFKGSNADYLNTYAGKMQLLSTAANEAQEKIGGALIQSLMDFTGAVDAADLATKIAHWGDALAKFIDDFTWNFKKFWFLTSDRSFLELLNPFSTYVKKGFAKIDAERAASAWKQAMNGALGFDPQNNALTGYKLDKAKADKVAADAAKRAKDLAAATSKQTAELKKQAALKKDSSIFDMQQIELVAALKGKLSDEDRKRAELQLAILNGNVDAANQLSKEVLMAQDATGQLYQYFMSLGDLKIKNPFDFLDTWIKNFQDKLNNLQAPNIQSGTSVNLTPNLFTRSNPASPYQYPNTELGGITLPSTNASVSMPSDSAVSYNQQTGLSYNPNNIQIQVTGEGTLTKAIADALQVQSLSGIPSSIQRLVSTFG